MNILKEIIEKSKPDLELRKKQSPIDSLIRNIPPHPSFADAFPKNKISIIAELKKASPSKGMIRENFNYLNIAREYEDNGAAAISVLTEKNYFLGSLEILKEVAKSVSIPLLRKDFIYDSYQVYEAAAAGAAAILLIAAMLEEKQIRTLTGIAHDLNLSVLGEAHTADEIKTLCKTPVDFIGVNARDLVSFHCSLETTEKLLQFVPGEKLAIAESSIKTKEDIQRLQEAGARAFLIGETFMRAPSPGKKLKEFLS